MTKKKIVCLIALAGCVSLLAAGCSQPTPQTATLTVAANPTTGYDWIVEQDPELFDVVTEYVQDDAEEDMVGVGGTESIILTPREPGISQVSFYYGRSSKEGDYDTRLTYTLSVNKKLKIKMQSATGALGGDISTVPEMPSLVIE